MTDDTELKLAIIEKLARKKVTGGNKKRVDTVKGWFRNSDQGKVETLIRELSTDPTAPVERYGGGARDNVRLTSIAAARQYLENHGEDVWF